MSAICPLRQKNLVLQPCGALSLRFVGGLPDHQFNVGHIEKPVGKLLHKPKLQEDFKRPLYGADLVAGQSGDHLRRIGHMLVKLQLPAAFQGFQVELQENIGIQDPVQHIFQKHDGVPVKKILLELEIVVFSVVCHRQPPFFGLLRIRTSFFGGKGINTLPPQKPSLKTALIRKSF